MDTPTAYEKDFYNVLTRDLEEFDDLGLKVAKKTPADPYNSNSILGGDGRGACSRTGG